MLCSPLSWEPLLLPALPGKGELFQAGLGQESLASLCHTGAGCAHGCGSSDRAVPPGEAEEFTEQEMKSLQGWTAGGQALCPGTEALGRGAPGTARRDGAWAPSWKRCFYKNGNDCVGKLSETVWGLAVWGVPAVLFFPAFQLCTLPPVLFFFLPLLPCQGGFLCRGVEGWLHPPLFSCCPFQPAWCSGACARCDPSAAQESGRAEERAE